MDSTSPAKALADRIIVVSGLPRSGTSVMMAMLRAGGVPLLTDGVREADLDNPNGYFEWEPVKRLGSDSTWMEQAKGKAIKIVAPLVFALPPRFEYRIIFMERNLDEMIASQAAMLRRMGRQPALPPDALKSAFARQLLRARQVLAPAQGRKTLFLNHGDLLADRGRVAVLVARFLEADLNVSAMAAMVDPSLHRQRITP